MKLKAKNLLFLLICTLLTTMLVPITVSADMGPKPSVRITFEGLGDELCYATLLSKTKSTGPSSAWDGNEKYAKHNENKSYYYETFDHATWKVFVEYEDPDGYYFLQEGWQVNETKELAWTYYPPSSFKILLYFPEQNVFVTSGIYERYAFDSYFTVDMTGISVAEGDVSEQPVLAAEKMEAEESYDHTWEVFSLIVRIFATILIEMAVALVFGLRKKKELLLLVGVNVVTQVVLNVALNVINYNAGHMAFTFGYVLLEIGVFVVEAAVYCAFMKRVSEKIRKNWVYVVYALFANVLSFVAGYGIAKVLLGIF